MSQLPEQDQQGIGIRTIALILVMVVILIGVVVLMWNNAFPSSPTATSTPTGIFENIVNSL
ncbi:MAG TPA: hypothetical protein VK003_15310 [Oceanobacillus sp.]|nr:hypothetical protein [Oceanobacillus sp.]